MRQIPCFLWLSLLFLCPAEAASAALRKPNIISIVTDDQARWAVGCYGNKDIVTPNMDRLAADGAICINAFVNTPVCSPSRAGFMTGLHGTELGITDWINMNEATAGVGLPTSAVTWPAVLQKNGYATALVGKWHLGHLPGNHPTKLGYDRFWGFLGGGTEPMNPHLEIDGKPAQRNGPVSDLMTDEAMRWIAEHRDKPFALSLHFREPHLPYGPVPDEDMAPFKDKDVAIPDLNILDREFTKDLTRKYYGAIHAVDRNLGRLLAKLDELKLADDTIVLFTSDHGYNIGQHGLHAKGNAQWIGGGVTGPKRPNMFEESIRVPLMIRWPGVIKPGTRVEQSVSNIDTFATILGMLKIAMRDNVKQHGRDFSPLLRSEQIKDWPTVVYAQYDLHNGGLAFLRMVRTPQWKLVRHHMSNGENELYDLVSDPREKQNRYYDQRAFPIRDELQSKLTAWEESINDPILKLDANRPIEMAPPVGQ